jgi:arylsulfatase A-like enzyme
VRARSWALAGLLVAALAAAWFAFGALNRAPRPNVLVLVMDTTRADRCSVNGYSRPTTPRLAEFAKDAAVYTDAWSPAGWTGPAHASLFTGLRPEHHGYDSGARGSLVDEHPTLAQILRDAGYATGCFTNNNYISPEFGLTRGFDRFEPFFRNDARAYPWAPATHDAAARWAETVHADRKPFFLFINDMEPHVPYTPPREIATPFLHGTPEPREIGEVSSLERSRELGHDLGVSPLTARQLAIMSDLYDAEIATLDREIGALLDRLKDDGLYDSTIIVIAGDHGENLGDHGLIDHGFSLHRSICHVPLLVRVPGAPAARIASVARLEDVLPTVLAACGLTPPDGIDGEPLPPVGTDRVARATLGQPEGALPWIRSLFPGVALDRISASIRSAYDGRRHYISYSDGREELYDVASDPDETKDLSKSEPQDAARMRALFER